MQSEMCWAGTNIPSSVPFETLSNEIQERIILDAGVAMVMRYHERLIEQQEGL